MKKIYLYIIAAILFILAFGLSPYYRVDVEGAQKTLKQSGYIPIQVGGYGWFSGSKSDWYSTKFKAIGPLKDTVTGVVTKGFFKGSTVRLD